MSRAKEKRGWRKDIYTGWKRARKGGQFHFKKGESIWKGDDFSRFYTAALITAGVGTEWQVTYVAETGGKRWSLIERIHLGFFDPSI